VSSTDSSQIAETTVLAVAVDAGRLSAGLVDARGHVLVRDRVSTPTRSVWRSLEQLLLRVLAARPGDVGEPVAVGVSCIGPVDVVAGSVSPFAIAPWSSFGLREHVAELTGLPVTLDTAAGAALLAERRSGDLVGVDSAMLVLCDHTVESAAVVAGERVSGAHGNAGSLAHLTVEPTGLRCRCGAAGCLDAYASASALESEMNRPLRRATPSTIERTGIMLGRAIASASAVFDVTRFAIGGVVVDTFGDPLIDAMQRELALRSRLEHLDGLVVEETSTYISPLVAAAAVALQADGAAVAS
jgi:glucokinase